MQWNKIADRGGPSARWGHAAFSIANKLYIFGGYADQQYMNDLWEYDSDKWTKLTMKSLLPEARSNHSVVTDGQNIYLQGGGGKQKQRFGDLWKLQLSEMKWTQVDVKLTPRTYHCCCYGLGLLIIFGGVDSTDISDPEVVDMVNMKKLNVQENKSLQARRFSTLNYMDHNRIILIGGCSPNYEPIPEIFVGEINREANTIHLDWHLLSYRFIRWGHSTNVYEGHIWISGGRSINSDLMDLVQMTQDGYILDMINAERLAPRRKHTATLVGNSILTFGGFNGEYLQDLNFIELKTKQLRLATHCDALLQLLSSELDTDFTFIHNDHAINVHKEIILNTLSWLGLNDYIQTIKDQDYIQVSDKLDHKILLDMIRYLYTRQLPVPDWTLLEQFKKNAELLFGQPVKFLGRQYAQKEDLQELTQKQLMDFLSFHYQYQPKGTFRRYISLPVQEFNNLFEQFKSEAQTQIKTYILNLYKQDTRLASNEGYIIPCSRMILASQSGFFMALFTSPFGDSKNENISIQNLNFKELLITIIYCYTGCIIFQEDIKQSDIQLMIEKSQYLDMPDLTELLLILLSQRINKQNLEETFEAAFMIEDERLIKECSHRSTEICQLQDITNQEIKQCVQKAMKERVVPLTYKPQKPNVSTGPNKKSNKENQNLLG